MAKQHHITSIPARGSAVQIGPVTSAIRAIHSEPEADDLPRNALAAIRSGLDAYFAALGPAEAPAGTRASARAGRG